MLEGVHMANKLGIDVELNCFGHHRLPRKHPVRKALSKNYDLKSCIKLNGWLSSRTEALEKMRECDILVLLRDTDISSIASFPTRLPEFLLSNRPLITSRAGDIHMYLRDRENAYLVPAGQRPKELADVLFRISRNRGEAVHIGRCGADVANQNFCHRKHGLRLAKFLTTLDTL
jgi:glycosyltransferase involved in cell wall biosynthesis